jgi:hypothetical protein
MFNHLIQTAGLPDLAVVENAAGGVDILSSNWRVLSINPAGGHYEVTTGIVAQGAGFDTDATQHPIVTQT